MAPEDLPDHLDSASADAAGPASVVPAGNTPYWWEDPDLAAAVAEVEEFVGAAGWDSAPQMFALVRTADLLTAQPSLAAALTDAGTFTPIAQDVLPTGDLSEALSTISWPKEVAGCVLVQEIVVLPPAAVPPSVARPPGGDLSGDPSRVTGGGKPAGGAAAPTAAAVDGPSRQANDVEITAEQAAAHPDRAEARLAAGVLRGTKGGASLLRVRGRDDATPLRGADLAPNLLNALQATFDD